MSVADNNSGEDRSATLTVKGERVNKYYTITVNQSRKARLFVTPVSKDYAATGGPLSFTISTNVPWEIRTDVSWLSFDRNNGQPDPDGRVITIVATAEPNDGAERVATVTVAAGGGEESFVTSEDLHPGGPFLFSCFKKEPVVLVFVYEALRADHFRVHQKGAPAEAHTSEGDVGNTGHWRQKHIVYFKSFSEVISACSCHTAV